MHSHRVRLPGRPGGFDVADMTEADLDQVLTIEVLSFPNPWTRGNFLSELFENPFAISRVVKHEDRVVAYVAAWQVTGELKINNVAVHPDWRRNDIARRLLLSLFEGARRSCCTVATLEVRVSNVGARRLYGELGFQEDGLRENYYPGDNEDAILMSLAL